MGGNVGAQFLEGGVGLAGGLNAQHVLNGVAYGVDPGLVRAVGVVGDGEGAGEGADGVGVGPGLLGGGLVEDQNLVAGDVLTPPVNDRGGEVRGGSAGGVVDGVADLLAVNGQ